MIHSVEVIKMPIRYPDMNAANLEFVLVGIQTTTTKNSCRNNSYRSYQPNGHFPANSIAIEKTVVSPPARIFFSDKRVTFLSQII